MFKILNLKRMVCVVFIAVATSVFAQKYEFTPVIDIEASNIKNQGKTGTCWSFSASSFLESEIYKKTGKKIDVSEMYNVRNTYPTKAWNYVMRQGKTQFSEGGLAHDVINSIRKYGLVPESAFSGVVTGDKYDHSKLVPELKKVLDVYIKNDKKSIYPNWKSVVDSILDVHIGKKPKRFYYNGIMYSPSSYLQMTQLDLDDYVNITSFSHHPYNKQFVLNVPDNFSNGAFYNVSLTHFTQVVDEALARGYTLALDCDVSEKTFSSKNGIAFIPKNEKDKEKGLTKIVEEQKITTELRQREFENYNTTDDHLMHIVGLVKDQKGNEYYKVKNSWGGNSKRIGNEGYVYMSKPYFELKAISVLVNKNALTDEVSELLFE